MNAPTRPPTHTAVATATDRRRIVFATVVGTTVEWYDFFIYAMTAGLVFGDVFFAPAGDGIATILSFLTVGISFLFRPLGAFLAGHYGDRYGRRGILIVTLVTMGAATTLVGLLPTYATVGITAPILLIILRILQGISAGGEWGGAVLMAVEHAPRGKRGVFGAAPQVGVPLGMLLASGVMALMTTVAHGHSYDTWGWRIPFLLSFVLIVVGHFIRRRVEESPVFVEIAQRRDQTKIPIVEVFRRHTVLVIVAALVFAGNSAVGYMTTGGYLQSYATDPDGAVGMARGPVLWAVAGSAATWLLFTWVGAQLSDRIGRRTTYLIGWVLLLLALFPLFPLINTGSPGLMFCGLALLTVGLGFTYGPQAALYTELFPASIRFSGVSISYALGAVLGGAFAPTIAAALMRETGTYKSIVAYLAIFVVVSFLATLTLRDRSGIALGLDQEALQAVSPVRGLSHA